MATPEDIPKEFLPEKRTVSAALMVIFPPLPEPSVIESIFAPSVKSRLSGNLRCWETLQFQQVNEELSVLAIRFFSNMVWMLYIICVTILVEIRLD